MSTKVKKPFYKRWWVWLIAIILIIAVFSESEEETDTPETETTAQATAEEDETNGGTEKDKDEEVAKKDVTEEDEEAGTEEEEEDDASLEISAGTYKVGDDIDAGEYLVLSDGMAYIEAAEDSTGELESIIFNENLMGEAHAYVTLEDGQYFKLQGGSMYPEDDAPSIVPEDGLYTDGMYKVGEDIPAGEYQVILDDASELGMGYLEVSSDSSHELESIITNDNVEADTYITVEEGQYLTIQDLTIEVE